MGLKMNIGELLKLTRTTSCHFLQGINRLVSNVWPWCLVGKEKTTKAASLGLNGLKRRTQRDPVLESFSPIPLDEGELEWFREAEIRHGKCVFSTCMNPLLRLGINVRVAVVTVGVENNIF